MRNNLKTIPKLGNYPDDGTPIQEFIDYVERVVKYFEDLEQEIREKKLFKIEKLKNPDEIITMTKRKFCEGFNREINDILGE